jgi:hypothetical protein
MSIEEIERCYLHTSTTTDGTPYPNLDAAKAALRFLLTREQGLGHNTIEQHDGRWISHQMPTGSVTIWIEDERANVVRMSRD